MLRLYSLGLSQFFLFAATVLAILANVGQVSQNIVARNIYLAKLKPGNVAQHLREEGLTADNIMANNQSALLQKNQGVRNLYAIGMYGYCGGKSLKDERTCTEMNFGYVFEPDVIIGEDLPNADSKALQDLFSRYDIKPYARKHWHPAFYLTFIGTIFVGVAFITTCLIHLAAIAVAGFFASFGFLLLGVGAAIWTADLYGLNNSEPVGLVITYGNALWFVWAACGSTLIGLPALFTSTYAGRTKWDDGIERGNYYQTGAY
ncbi:hypothetical protein MCUN1_001065 [Malassezia cuniculi]|uniref:Integral membrane protein n=1 Tax=Malassezia cuniculi TaxID=948313 RepID=A0AAF0J5I0_9BASI|nr:hypothetical protein MCUN1_001065 [Malassezia cuniculi]